MIDEQMEQIEQRVTNLELAFGQLVMLIGPSLPLATRGKVESILDKILEASSQIGGFRRINFDTKG